MFANSVIMIEEKRATMTPITKWASCTGTYPVEEQLMRRSKLELRYVNEFTIRGAAHFR